jgi:hypothetical protein
MYQKESCLSVGASVKKHVFGKRSSRHCVGHYQTLALSGGKYVEEFYFLNR